MFGEVYELVAFTLRTLLCPYATFCFLGSNIFLLLFSVPSIYILPSEPD
jgi:hypothetical protein